MRFRRITGTRARWCVHPTPPGGTRAPRPRPRPGAASAARMLPARGERALGDLEAPIEGLELEVAAHHVADQGVTHRVAARFAGEELGARGLGGAPVLAPEIDLPREAQHQAVVVAGEELRGNRHRAHRRGARAPFRGLHAHRGELVRARDGELRPRLLDTLGGGAQVAVGGERLVDQLVEHRVVEHHPPALGRGHARLRPAVFLRQVEIGRL